MAALPAAHALLASANLSVHPAVQRVILHGSRGPAGTYRPDSDIDLSLLIDPPPADEDDCLQAVFETTFQQWRAPVEPDLAVIFESRACGLVCFDIPQWDPAVCRLGGRDCFGLYKAQKGFHGRVTGAGVEVRRMYPCLKIWQRL